MCWKLFAGDKQNLEKGVILLTVILETLSDVILIPQTFHY